MGKQDKKKKKKQTVRKKPGCLKRPSGRSGPSGWPKFNDARKTTLKKDSALPSLDNGGKHGRRLIQHDIQRIEVGEEKDIQTQTEDLRIEDETSRIECFPSEAGYEGDVDNRLMDEALSPESSFSSSERALETRARARS